MSYLQVTVVILTEKLEEAKNRLHYNDHKAHLSFILVLVPSAGLAVRCGEVVLRVGLTPVRVKCLLGCSGGL